MFTTAEIDAAGGPSALAAQVATVFIDAANAAAAADRTYLRSLVARVLAEPTGLDVDSYEATFGSDEIDDLTDRHAAQAKAYLPGDPRRHPTYSPTLDEVRAFVDRVR